MISSSSLSVVELKEFSSNQLRDRFQALVTELRCPKCQNQNLADSNSPISADLRTEIFRMLEEGSTDQEIIDFLVVRYGEFVMYRPPVKKTTLILWLAPGLLLIAGIIIIMVMRRRHALDDATATSILASEELERLNKLLGDDNVMNTGTMDTDSMSTSAINSEEAKPDSATDGKSK
jgi:cytochrome c-type biogenesis protein CcmH